ncbi:helix-turn-helix domain-containing protein [Bradyrhizobium pachyrhizi]|uniref:Helix-turn-helix domain-containing protein n=1 Tax=Bradyrhizobium pachyrhizi TaxID=280333 RepID=A0A844SBG4_9BRAD|nr:AraC family transcriptional regulator [Bradyrhizobium pachyrhizi]MVT64613.1 helix-turn-helix domain-containing protein [Bradyrhizobium pachyrhizi]
MAQTERYAGAACLGRAKQRLGGEGGPWRKAVILHPTEDGMVSLLRDRTMARVVLAILNDLARNWTLDDMAQVAIASRATLVRAFRKHAGTAPMTFLSDLRLATARKRLAGTSDPIATIAIEVG